jgi:WXG100 family type VII secretion target
MNIKEITVNTSTLNSDIGELQTALDSAKAQLEDMFNQITELDTMWDGDANEEFNKQFRIDYDNTKSLFDTIKSLIECMEYARDQYNSCENEVGNLVNSIKI